nr:mitochondrial outer membrane protein porin 2-like [Ipomoea trifida]
MGYDGVAILLFFDFGKNAKEMLTTGYSSYQKFTVASRSHDGVAIVSVLAKKGSLSPGYVEAKLPDYKSGMFKAQYFNEHARFTMAMGLNKSPDIDVSATIGTPHIAFGTEASYAFAFRDFTKYNKKRGTVVGEMERKFSANESTLIVRCSYAVDAHRTMKAKLNNHGKLGALVQHELKPKSSLTVLGRLTPRQWIKSPNLCGPAFPATQTTAMPLSRACNAPLRKIALIKKSGLQKSTTSTSEG